MSDTITVTGLIATIPRNLMTAEGLHITSFRLASTQRRFDRAQQKWVDGDTNWFTVTAFRHMATNAAGSLHKGDRVLVTGRMHIRDWASDGRNGTTVEIEADALGHDLFWGTTAFTRTIISSLNRSEEPAAESFPEGEPTPPAEEAEQPEADQVPPAQPVVPSDPVALPF
jgi:single-strand DNA-binding protein